MSSTSEMFEKIRDVVINERSVKEREINEAVVISTG